MRGRERSPILPAVLTWCVIFTASPGAGVPDAGTTPEETAPESRDRAATAPLADDARAALMERIKVVREKETQITWYSPRFEPYSSFDFRVYPIIGLGDQGWRKIGLQFVLKDPPRGRPQSLRAVLDGEPWIIPIPDSTDIDTHEGGCRVTQTLLLQNQESFVRALAAASEARLSLVGYGRTVRHTLSPEDRDHFQPILALWAMETPPAMKEEPSRIPPPPDADYAGVKGVTNPEIIPKTKVQPRFPRIAEGKNVLGRVVLQTVVRRDGTVGDIAVLQEAGGDCGFEAAAIDAVRQWRYKPGTRNGEPVDVYFTIVIDFTYGHYRMAPG